RIAGTVGRHGAIQNNLVSTQVVAAALNQDSTKVRTRWKIIDVRFLSSDKRKDQVRSSYGNDIAGPVCGCGPVAVHSATIPQASKNFCQNDVITSNAAHIADLKVVSPDGEQG